MNTHFSPTTDLKLALIFKFIYPDAELLVVYFLWVPWFHTHQHVLQCSFISTPHSITRTITVAVVHEAVRRWVHASGV